MQVGSIATYVSYVWGWSSIAHFYDKLTDLCHTGATKGKLGVHMWDVSVAEATKLDFLIVSILIRGSDLDSNSVR